MRIEFNGKVKEDGQLHIYNRSQFVEAVKRLTGKQVDIIVRKKVKRRSNQQLRYYKGPVLEMITNRLNELGHRVSKEETNVFLKGMFLYKEIPDPRSGEMIKVPRDLKEDSEDPVTTTDLMGFIADLQQWSSEYLDLYVPDPGEQLKVIT